MTNEELIWKSVKGGLRIEGVDETNCNMHHRVTYGGITGTYGKENGYKITLININNHLIEVFYHKSNKIGYLGYYHYISNGVKFDIYVPVDYVLEGKIFYTDRKEYRRNYKVRKLIENIKV